MSTGTNTRIDGPLVYLESPGPEHLPAIWKVYLDAPDYFEALTYKNLLLRMQGNEETDLAKRAALYKQADDLRNRAIELNKKRAAGAK